MSDNKNFDEEYQYVEEPDGQTIEVESEPIPEPKVESSSTNDYANKINSLIKQPSVKRNAMIAIGALLILLTLLKCAAKPSVKQEMEEPKPLPMKQIGGVPVRPMQQDLGGSDINTLMDMQKNMQANLVAMNDKVNALTGQLNTLNSNNQVLQQQLSQLLSKLQSMQQSLDEAIASAKARPQIQATRSHAIRSRHYEPAIPRLNYFVQAIIPGRAWLISSQGKTVTVRVGSIIPGYGTVKFIDAKQGRVMMSSSKVFVFNQAD